MSGVTPPGTAEPEFGPGSFLLPAVFSVWYKMPLPLIAKCGDGDAIGGPEAKKSFKALEEGRFLKIDPRRQRWQSSGDPGHRKAISGAPPAHLK